MLVLSNSPTLFHTATVKPKRRSRIILYRTSLNSLSLKQWGILSMLLIFHWGLPSLGYSISLIVSYLNRLSPKHGKMPKMLDSTEDNDITWHGPALRDAGITRSSKDRLLLVPRTKCTTFGDRAFSVYGPRQWNKLPKRIRESKSVDSFKQGWKQTFAKKSEKCVEPSRGRRSRAKPPGAQGFSTSKG